jgi:hypothetical protein
VIVGEHFLLVLQFSDVIIVPPELTYIHLSVLEIDSVHTITHLTQH